MHSKQKKTDQRKKRIIIRIGNIANGLVGYWPRLSGGDKTTETQCPPKSTLDSLAPSYEAAESENRAVSQKVGDFGRIQRESSSATQQQQQSRPWIGEWGSTQTQRDKPSKQQQQGEPLITVPLPPPFPWARSTLSRAARSCAGGSQRAGRPAGSPGFVRRVPVAARRCAETESCAGGNLRSGAHTLRVGTDERANEEPTARVPTRAHATPSP